MLFREWFHIRKYVGYVKGKETTWLNGFSLGSVVYEARSLSYITGTAPFTITVSKHVFVNIDYPNPIVHIIVLYSQIA